MALMVRESEISGILRGTQFPSSEEFGVDTLDITVVPILFDVVEGRIHFSLSRSYTVGTQGNLSQLESFALSLPIELADPDIGIRPDEIIIGPEPLSRIQPEFTNSLRRTFYTLADERNKKPQLSSRQIVLKTADGIVRFADTDSDMREQFQTMIAKAQHTYGNGPFGSVLEEISSVTLVPTEKTS